MLWWAVLVSVIFFGLLIADDFRVEEGSSKCQ